MDKNLDFIINSNIDKIKYLSKKLSYRIDNRKEYSSKEKELAKIILEKYNNDLKKINSKINELIKKWESIDGIDDIEIEDVHSIKYILDIQFEKFDLNVLMNTLRSFINLKVCLSKILLDDNNEIIKNKIPFVLKDKIIEDYRSMDDEISYLSNIEPEVFRLLMVIDSINQTKNTIYKLKEIISYISNDYNIVNQVNIIDKLELLLDDYKIIISEKIDKYYKLKKGLNVGISGEKLVYKQLNIHDKFKILQNCRLKDHNGIEVECDTIVVCNKGIFVLEVKNIGLDNNFNIEIDNTGRWIKIFSDGNRMPINSAVEQNSRHLAVVNNILYKNNVNLYAKGIIAIPNDNINILNKTSQKIIRASYLYEFIMKSRLNLNDSTVIYIYNLLKNNTLPIKKNKYRDYINEGINIIKNNSFEENLNNINKYLNSYYLEFKKIKNIKDELDQDKKIIKFNKFEKIEELEQMYILLDNIESRFTPKAIKKKKRMNRISNIVGGVIVTGIFIKEILDL